MESGSSSGGVRVSDFLLYGLDEAGEAVFSEVLVGHDRLKLPEVARTRLSEWHGVEIWEGPMCVLRMQRSKADI